MGYTTLEIGGLSFVTSTGITLIMLMFILINVNLIKSVIQEEKKLGDRYRNQIIKLRENE